MESAVLKTGSSLSGGKYKITHVLGQGGFGITYEAEQVSLGRKVAIKEFFMKEHCDRDETTSAVTVPSSGSRELVEKFRQKFIREAQMIAGFDNEHIVKIHDVFEENGTAYYVMEYLGGGSLTDMVKSRGALSESVALNYIRQIADALNYLHEQNTLHLDVKPSNVLLNQKGQLKLIDFGISKHYDEAGSQTSSTPVGISKGYAPLEQYQQGGDVSKFTPATDIYALGATLYFLVTGTVPPDASEVNEEGLPQLPTRLSTNIKNAIEKAMAPRRKDRPQTITAFLSLLDAKEENGADDEETTTVDTPAPAPSPAPSPRRNAPKWLWVALSAAAAIILSVVLWPKPEPKDPGTLTAEQKVDQVQPVKEEPVKQEVIALQKIELSRTSLTIEEGKSATLSVKYTPSEATDKTTTWESSNASVAKVDRSGKVSAMKEGNATIIAKSGTLTSYCNVKVSAKQVQPAPVQQSAQSSQSTKPVTGTLAGHEWVDLGLPSGLKWATTNVGASNPGDYGSYFAWGETSPKSSYSWDSYKWCNGLFDSLTKYNTKSMNGTTDYKDKLALSDDAARQNWGSSWRMPTKQEFEELKSNCTQEWTTMNGHEGRRFTSKKNGKSIFLPAAGWLYVSNLERAGSYGSYWSSSLNTDDPENAWDFYVTSGVSYTTYDNRYYGRSVRPVTE